MLISLLLIGVAAGGGFAITYLIDEDAPLAWRAAAGIVIGSALCGTLTFLFALGFGLNAAVVLIALALTASPVLLFAKPALRNTLRREWLRAKSKLQGAGLGRFLRLAYYAFFFLLFFFFFDRVMLESAAGIFTGGSQNLGDLPFHLGAIYSFTEANNFPPQNPSFAGARFSYPFIADLLTASAIRLGADARDAMFIQNLSWAFSLVIILERFVLKLTNDRLAARIAPFLLFFSGGLGFIWFLGDYWSQAKGFFDVLSQLQKDYTISEMFRWGNSMIVLFMTQRSLLLGMPLTLIVLGYLWKWFAIDAAASRAENGHNGARSISGSPSRPLSYSPPIVGLLAGMLPLVHLHSLAALFVVGVFLFILRPERWFVWLMFAGGVGIVAIPELIWSVAGSATEASKFFAWHFGWDKGDKNFLWFWFINTGIFIPMLIAGLYLASSTLPDEDTKSDKKKKKARKAGSGSDHSPLTTHHSPLYFYLPFAFLFLVSNVAKLAPWEWDNIKILIYWFVGSVAFVALVIAWMWQRSNAVWKVAAAVCFVVLIASGALDVWRCVSGQINYKVFDKDAVELASQIRVRTPRDAMFLNAPTYNTAIVLAGRQSLMRYPGHLGSHGIDYTDRENDLRSIYSGVTETEALMNRYEIDYVLFGPEVTAYSQERHRPFTLREDYFKKYPVVAESGQYRVYKIR